MHHHDSNQPILSIFLSISGALISFGNFVPVVQFTAALVGTISGCIAIYKQVKKRK
jgi:membrane associated rhomboid family serine protease